MTILNNRHFETCSMSKNCALPRKLVCEGAMSGRQSLTRRTKTAKIKKDDNYLGAH